MKEYVDVNQFYEWFKDKKKYRKALKEHKEEILRWRNILKDVIPPILGRNIKKKYGEDPQWILYGEKLCRNKFMRDQLLEREKYICPVCGKKILKSKAVIHHRNYDNICKYNKSEKNIPCCKECSINNPEYFNECEKGIICVHPYCNYIINICKH